MSFSISSLVAGFRPAQRLVLVLAPSRFALQAITLGSFAMLWPTLSLAAGEWPHVVDLSIGESCEVATRSGPKRVVLKSVSEKTEPDFYIAANARRATFSEATIEVEVAGQPGRIVGRPYQLPMVINGVRLYLEATRAWGTEANVQALADLTKAVRLSVLDADENWGPTDLVFPIDNFRWRSSTYNNTWGSLVPYNLLYYHRGEDFGAVPDRLPVTALFSGTIVQTPLAHGSPTGSNHVAIKSSDGVVVVYGHMNYETIDPAIVLDAEVKAGQLLGKTGSTWNGARNQKNDPHLHVGLHRTNDQAESNSRFPIRSSLFPMLIQAYFRKYPDPLLAIAGGYRFTTIGGTVEFDASRSVARTGEEIASYEWRMHDGSRVSGARAEVHYSEPGLYSEELIVRTKRGAEDRDFVQVRVYDPKRPIGHIGAGWFFHSPVRNIRPGAPVTFWNRLNSRTDAPVQIDFGDGTEPRTIAAEAEHAFAKPGIYSAKLTTIGPERESLTIQMRVVVDL